MDTNSIYKKILNIFKSNDKSIESIQLKNNMTYDVVNIEEKAAIKIKLTSKSKYVSVKSRYSIFFNDNPPKYKILKSDPDWIRYDIITEHDLDEISSALLKIYDEYKPSGTMFGCCSRFNACSDAMECVQPDKKYAKNCWYNENLKQGKIFYGINRNI
jgi:hypothetical protein